MSQIPHSLPRMTENIHQPTSFYVVLGWVPIINKVTGARVSFINEETRASHAQTEPATAMFVGVHKVLHHFSHGGSSLYSSYQKGNAEEEDCNHTNCKRPQHVEPGKAMRCM